MSLLSLAAAVPAPAAVRVLESDATRVLLEIVPESPQAEIVAGANREYVRVTVPGMGMVDETGKPEVPIGSVRVGLPPGKVPRLRIVSQSWSSPRPGAITPVPERVGVRDPFGASQVVERAPDEGAAYRSASSYPERPFRLSEVRNLRGLNVVSVVYHGVIAEVFSRSHRVLERAVVEVRFEEDRARTRAPLARPVPRDRLWDRTMRGTVANPEAARAWARGGPGDGTSVGNTPWGPGTQWKVHIEETGVTEISHSALSGQGFPSGVPVDDIDVYQRSFDQDAVDDPSVPAESLFVPIPIAVHVRDRDNDGFFSAGDGILLFGQSFRDRWMTSGMEHEDKYDDRNFVWLRIAAGGARMPMVRVGGSLSGNPADSLTSTPSMIHIEKDIRYYKYPPDHQLGPQAIESEIYYWNEAKTSTGVDPVQNDRQRGWTLGWPPTDSNQGDAFDVVDLAPGGAASLTVRVIPGGGGRNLNPHKNFNNVLWFYVNGDSVGDRAFWNAGLFIGDFVPAHETLNEYTLTPGLLADGTNMFNLRGFTYDGRTPVPGVNDNFTTRFFLDWYEVTYDRRLAVRGDRIAVSTVNGPGGNVLVRAEGFSGSDGIRLFEVTDPLTPAWVGVDPSQVVAGASGFDLRFDHDNAGGIASYAAVREASIPLVPQSNITEVRESTALGAGVGAPYVAVSHGDFLSGAQELAAYRSGRYPGAYAADVEDVYDIFWNGGAHPEAIKMFSTYAYHRWSNPIAFLCLVGDASEDHRGMTSDSDPDYVPSQGLLADYEGVAEDSDQYFAEVTRAGPGQLWDDLSDIYVGRLPVGTPDELAWNLARMQAYETAVADETWRRRVLLLADDQFSGSLGGGFGIPYGWKFSEDDFKDVSEEIADTLAAHPIDDLIPVKLYLPTYSHPCPDSCYAGSSPADCETEPGVDCGLWYDCRHPEWNEVYLCMRESVFSAVLPELRRNIDSGVLMWNFQGHANRFFMTHEEVFRDDTIGGRDDVDALDNFEKPFIFLGFACHLAEFDAADERTLEDCVSEKMMNKVPPDHPTEPPGGAVAVFASSGFEFLTPNLGFNKHVIDAFFSPHKSSVAGVGGGLPTDLVEDGVYKWTLGESTLRARLLYQQDHPNAGTFRQAAQRYVLLGDPALEPNVGGPRFEVSVNGETVTDGQFLGLQGVEETMLVEAQAFDGRGVVGMRVVDSALGEVDSTRYQVEDTVTSPHGVVQGQRLTYTASVRAESYDVILEAEDGGGAVSAFTLRLRDHVAIEEATAYPNPFSDATELVFVLTGPAEDTKVEIYTINGRRIWDASLAATPDANAVTWTGHDSGGSAVANGTYLVRIRASGVNTAETTFPIVKMR